MKNEILKTIITVIIGILFIIGIGFWVKNLCNPEPEWTSIGTWRVTAYCSCEKCCGDWADGITASGHRLVGDEKVIAAPVEFKFGTVMDVGGYGVGTVLDRGGAITGRRLDVYFPSHQEALNWGVEYIEIRVR